MREAVIILVLVALSWQRAVSADCTAAGRYAVTDDTTCQTYTLCVLNATSDAYVSYVYTCPTTSVFDPTTSVCTSPDNYVCNNTANTTSVCTEDGYIADPDSADCSGYIECVLIDGTYAETAYTCPDATYFDPNTTNCEADYNCTSSSSFTCSAAGRFADDDDATCQTYYLCVLLADSTFDLYTYTCPSTSVFNPNTKLCTANYTCTNS